MTTYFALHGFTGTSASFDVLGLDAVVCPILGGHGAAPCLTRKTFEEEVDYLLELARRLNAPKLHLLGYSMGARLALALLLEGPELFTHATLIGVNPGLETAEARRERANWESEWIRILEQEGIAGFEEKWSSQVLFSSQKDVSPARLQAQREARLSHTGLGLAHAMSSLGLSQMPNLWTKLTKLAVHTRLIVGSEDAKFRLIAQRMQAATSKFEAIELSGVGHNPILECPTEIRQIVMEGRARLVDDDALGSP